MHTGEDDKGLRKILDMTRLISIVLLVLHFYNYYYRAFEQWNWTFRLTDQLKKDYGRDQADVIMNITGNIICEQVTGDTAKQLSERFGKIMQDRASFSINRSDTSINRSKQLESAIPASKIASLSSGQFVGMVSDDPDQRIDLKAFHAEILNDHAALKVEHSHYKNIPIIREVTNTMVQKNYLQIKKEVEDLVNAEIQRMLSDPEIGGFDRKKREERISIRILTLLKFQQFIQFV